MAAGTDSGGGGSNIRVTVRWAEPNVFAGEEVRCRITFRNVAKPAPPAPPSVENSNDAASSSSSSSALRQQHARPRQASPLSNSVTPAGLAPPSASRPGAGAAAQHRSTMSLNVPAGAATARQRSGTTTGTATPPGTGTGTWAGGGEASGAGGSSGSSSPQQQPPPTPTQGGRPHRRSISIVSMASSSGTAEEAGHQQASPAQSNGGGASRGRAAGHSRSSSFHITPRGLAAVPNGPASATLPHRTLQLQTSSSLRSDGSATSAGTDGLPSPVSASGQFAGFRFPLHESAMASGGPASFHVEEDLTSPRSVGSIAGQLQPQQQQQQLQQQQQQQQQQQHAWGTIPKLAAPAILERSAPTAKILASTATTAGTPRSSGEFYSLSNNSNETLASEYVTPQQPLRGAGPPPVSSNRQQQQQQHARRTSNLPAGGASASARTTPPELLMMGYAQVQGSFTLDGSLIDLAPFEHVKRKAVVGGQGGGVIGVETAASSAAAAAAAASKRDSGGLLRGFGLGVGLGWAGLSGLGGGGAANGAGGTGGISGAAQVAGAGGLGAAITSSIGELLGGGGELSSIREMKSLASSRRVPLLSTPQSILFVDLQLAPGESRSFDYAFRLPRGLPPTHRGRAMKISYGLVIGTQRPGGAREQRLRSVEVPFRVLGSVNAHGDVLGHDLMEPYVLLRDVAKVQPVLDDGTAAVARQQPQREPPPLARPKTRQQHKAEGASSSPSSNDPRHAAPPSAPLNDFLAYVGELLNHPRSGSGAGLLSPTAAPTSSSSGAGLPQSRRSSSIYHDHPHSPSLASPSPSPSAFPGFFPHHPAPTSAKEAIDLAVLRSSSSSASAPHPAAASASASTPPPAAAPSSTRFEIARDGQRVAVVLLARAAYRLGERVLVAVDFEGADVPTLALHAGLETQERVVDAGLALRSEASVARATRRVWSSRGDVVMYGRRAVFGAGIPAYHGGADANTAAGGGGWGGTPEFVTSAVALEWCIRFEFVVPVAKKETTVATAAQKSQQQQQQQRSQQKQRQKQKQNKRKPAAAAAADAQPGSPTSSGSDDDESASSVHAHRAIPGRGATSSSDDDDDDDDPDSDGSSTSSHRDGTTRHAPPEFPPLLEEISRDDRGGLVLVAAEKVACESFEVAVPIRVYGAVCPGGLDEMSGQGGGGGGGEGRDGYGEREGEGGLVI